MVMDQDLRSMAPRWNVSLRFTEAMLKTLARVCIKTGTGFASANIQPLAICHVGILWTVSRWQGALTTGKSIAECIGPILFGFLFEARLFIGIPSLAILEYGWEIRMENGGQCWKTRVEWEFVCILFMYNMYNCKRLIFINFLQFSIAMSDCRHGRQWVFGFMIWYPPFWYIRDNRG